MASADSLSFQLGRTGSECVRIKMLRRNHPTATDFWDANWLSVRVQVFGGGLDLIHSRRSERSNHGCG